MFVFLEKVSGRCLAIDLYDESGLSSRHQVNYTDDGSAFPPLKSNALFSMKEGELTLQREVFFIDYDSEISGESEECWLSHYGLPEPLHAPEPSLSLIHI